MELWFWVAEAEESLGLVSRVSRNSPSRSLRLRRETWLDSRCRVLLWCPNRDFSVDNPHISRGSRFCPN